MKRTSFVIVFLALLSLVLFSGQQRRTTTNRKPQRPATTTRTSKQPSPPPLPEEKPQVPIQYLYPEDVHWPHPINPLAPRNVTLIGDPRESAMYVTRTLLPKGAKGVPHFHSDTRTVVVLSGTCHYGTGDEFDEAKLVALPPGSLILEPAGEPHCTWARDGDVVLQTTGIGPTKTEFPKPRKPEPK